MLASCLSDDDDDDTSADDRLMMIPQYENIVSHHAMFEYWAWFVTYASNIPQKQCDPNSWGSNFCFNDLRFSDTQAGMILECLSTRLGCCVRLWLVGHVHVIGFSNAIGSCDHRDANQCRLSWGTLTSMLLWPQWNQCRLSWGTSLTYRHINVVSLDAL